MNVAVAIHASRTQMQQQCRCTARRMLRRWAWVVSPHRMEVSLNANMVDQQMSRVADVLSAAFQPIAKDVSKDYGGTIQHLWIDFELIQSFAERRPPFPFRFQKKVGGSVCRLSGLPTPLCLHVGHYSVRPDFQKLLALPLESVSGYALGLIYASTSVLLEKQKKLGGFDAPRFRVDFRSSCQKHGFEIDHEIAG